MNNKQLNETSKFLSYVLRHEPQSIGLQLDKEGWAEIHCLIAGAAKEGRILDRDLILSIVSSSDKKRFSISNDAQYIRAVQGHSTESVDLQHIEKEPPEFFVPRNCNSLSRVNSATRINCRLSPSCAFITRHDYSHNCRTAIWKA